MKIIPIQVHPGKGNALLFLSLKQNCLVSKLLVLIAAIIIIFLLLFLLLCCVSHELLKVSRLRIPQKLHGDFKLCHLVAKEFLGEDTNPFLLYCLSAQPSKTVNSASRWEVE